MASWKSGTELDLRELRRMAPAVHRAVDRFRRQIERAQKRAADRRTLRRNITRRPAQRMGRPQPHPAAQPIRMRGRTPRTVLRQRRAANPSPLAEAVQQGAERAAGALRQRLLDLRGALGRLRRRFRRSSRYGR